MTSKIRRCTWYQFNTVLHVVHVINKDLAKVEVLPWVITKVVAVTKHVEIRCCCEKNDCVANYWETTCTPFYLKTKTSSAFLKFGLKLFFTYHWVMLGRSCKDEGETVCRHDDASRDEDGCFNDETRVFNCLRKALGDKHRHRSQDVKDDHKQWPIVAVK